MNDLEWIARNVHEWRMTALHVGRPRYGEAICWDTLATSRPHYTQSQWLAERARIQNKPSWGDASKWAMWLAQDANGNWNFYSDKPLLRGNFWSRDHSACRNDTRDSHPLAAPSLPANEVLGDWRDTLERRPEANTTPELDYGTGRNPTTTPAPDFLSRALGHMQDRASTYDNEEGERSMASTVGAFNAITGRDLTEEEGWLFMIMLKCARTQQGEFKSDNYEDGAAYFGLMGESASRDRG